MSDAIELIEFPSANGISLSPFCTKVRFCLQLKELPFTATRVLSSKTSPTGKLPFLRHDGQTISDSSEIARYLDRVFPQRPLVPADTAAKIHLIEDWADEALAPPLQYARMETRRGRLRFIEVALPGVPSPFKQALAAWRSRNRKKRFSYFYTLGQEAMTRQMDQMFDSIDWLAQENVWLAGSTPTLADASVAAPLAMFLDHPNPAMDAFRRRSHASGWLDRFLSHLGVAPESVRM
jgi:glutathione S-transferase